MLTLTASLCFALILPGTPGGEGSATESAPVLMAAASTDSNALSGLTNFSQPAPMLAEPEAMIKPVVNPVTPIKPVKRTETPVLFGPKSWLAMTAIQHSAATFDAWSTRYSITSGRGHELNPLMKPFAGSGAIYGVIQLAPLGTDYLGRRLMSSKHPTLRKLWWLPQAAGAAGFMFSGINNVRVANR